MKNKTNTEMPFAADQMETINNIIIEFDANQPYRDSLMAKYYFEPLKLSILEIYVLEEIKRSHDGIIFGSGIYQMLKDRAREQLSETLLRSYDEKVKEYSTNPIYRGQVSKEIKENVDHVYDPTADVIGYVVRLEKIANNKSSR
ncbi:MAG: hypothetical protein E7159_00620 [Firmicutes bacterium]|jgi:hypothetical protein|nr:hypothetical protein [Bacillota bacterium]